jgi:pimeloyl-ACP methyl ester carboxylesterase
MQPFIVNIDRSVLSDLDNRILATRWTDSISGSGWQFGVSLPYMKELAAYWANKFDWRTTEAAINAHPNFITEIDGYRIHYLHIKGKGDAAVPLLISHGWPGSFLEMLKIIPLLTDDPKDGSLTFDLVIPSLLGFGFSEKPDHEGINATLMAGIWVKLMSRLGYEKFIAQGGDFGAMISTRIALNDPGRLIGLHLNYIPFNYKPWLPPGEKLTEEEGSAQQKTYRFFQAEGAYAQIQGTKPLTLSYGLTDSPVGLAAWILQIFHSFSRPGVSVEQLFGRDELLAHITLYWITGTIHSSMRLYHEMVSDPLEFGKDDFIKVPTGIAHYPYPDSFPARRYVERGYNVQYWNDLPEGGHFAAMEQPQLFAADLKEFVAYLYKKIDNDSILRHGPPRVQLRPGHDRQR